MSMTQAKPPLDRWRFDALIGGPERLWGLTAIAQALGVSVSKVRRMARQDSVPIYKPEGGGKYFAFRSELVQWLRSK